jgi:hypothetical protein
MKASPNRIIKAADGRERSVGHIFYTETAMAKGPGVWFWSVEFHQRRERIGPHQGHEPDDRQQSARLEPDDRMVVRLGSRVLGFLTLTLPL